MIEFYYKRDAFKFFPCYFLTPFKWLLQEVELLRFNVLVNLKC